MMDKAHQEILELLDELREVETDKINDLHGILSNICSYVVKNEKKLEELENDLTASIGETQELREALAALKAWTEVKLID